MDIRETCSCFKIKFNNKTLLFKPWNKNANLCKKIKKAKRHGSSTSKSTMKYTLEIKIKDGINIKNILISYWKKMATIFKMVTMKMKADTWDIKTIGRTIIIKDRSSPSHLSIKDIIIPLNKSPEITIRSLNQPHCKWISIKKKKVLYIYLNSLKWKENAKTREK